MADVCTHTRFYYSKSVGKTVCSNKQCKARFNTKTNKWEPKEGHAHMNLYLVCVTLKPTDKDKFDNGASPSVIVQPTAIFAKDETTAALRAGGLVSAITPAPDPNRVEVQVIPFRACAR